MRESIRREAVLLGTLAFLSVLVIYGIPLSLTLRGSVVSQQDLGSVSRFVGLNNFKHALQNQDYAQSFLATVAFTLPSVALQLGLAFAAALLSRRNFRGAGFVRWGLLTSYFLPSVVVVIAWKFFTDPFVGLLPGLLRTISFPVVDFRGPDAALPGMILTGTYEAFPFTYVILLSRMMQIPQSLYQVTELSGATPWMTFRTVTWPQVRQVVGGLVVLRILITWPKFDIPWLVYASQASSRWGDTLAVTIYRTAFERLQNGEAFAVSLLLLSAGWAFYGLWSLITTTERNESR